MADVIVIGGGLLGMGTAYHLAREGASVLVIDRMDRGRATDAGAGILSPESSAAKDDVYFRLAVRAGAYYPEFIERLQSEQSGPTGYERSELLVVAMESDEQAFQEAKQTIFGRQAARQAPSHEDLHETTPARAREMFPALGEVRAAIYHRQAARVDARLLTAALRRAGERYGLQVLQGNTVDGLILEDGRVTGVRLGNEVIACKQVVIAGGAWSPTFGAQLGMQIPVEPHRGQIIHLRVDGNVGQWPILVGLRGHYLLPFPDGRVVVGATREANSGYALTLTAGGVLEVLREALRVAPGLHTAEVVEMRVGLRPASKDGRPVMGPVPGVGGVYLNTGHGPGGLQLGPYSAKVVADMVLGKEPDAALAPFLPERFVK